MNTSSDKEIRAILEEYNYDFYKISQNKEVREKVNRQNFKFDEAIQFAKDHPLNNETEEDLKLSQA